MQVLKSAVKDALMQSLEIDLKPDATLSDCLNNLDTMVFDMEFRYFFYEEAGKTSLNSLIYTMRKLQNSISRISRFALIGNNLLIDKHKGKNKIDDLFAEFSYNAHTTMLRLNEAHFYMLIKLKILFLIRSRGMIEYSEIQMSFNDLLNSLNYFSKYEISLFKQFNRFRNKIVHSPSIFALMSMGEIFYTLLIENLNAISKVNDRISQDFSKKFTEVKEQFEENEKRKKEFKDKC